ncbi:MAG: hypothetical protein ABI051_15665 [Vicinamibacterales bacterium]
MRGLLYVHLTCATTATILFWIAAGAVKGGYAHRLAGRTFGWLITCTAATGAVMAIARLAVPSLIRPNGIPIEQWTHAVDVERQTMWLVLYVLLIIVTPVQHGFAVVAARATPARARSSLHALLTFGAMLGSLVIIPAALLWQQWLFLVVGPLGLIIGLRQLSYVTRTSAMRPDWEREHLTSLITAGVTLHTALLVFGTSRTLAMTLQGPSAVLPWLAPALIGAPIVWWQRRKRRAAASK